MAEGGRDKDDNPYSFKKFIKSKNNSRMPSDSDNEHSEEDGAVDLLEKSGSLTRGANITQSGKQLTALELFRSFISVITHFTQWAWLPVNSSHDQLVTRDELTF